MAREVARLEGLEARSLDAIDTIVAFGLTFKIGRLAAAVTEDTP